jgi:hypothetical protein
MKKILPLLLAFSWLTLSNCTNANQNADAQKTALEEKEAVALDSLSEALEQNKAEIEAGLQKLEESLNEIEN